MTTPPDWLDASSISWDLNFRRHVLTMPSSDCVFPGIDLNLKRLRNARIKLAQHRLPRDGEKRAVNQFSRSQLGLRKVDVPFEAQNPLALL